MSVERDHQNNLTKLGGETAIQNLIHGMSSYIDVNKKRETPFTLDTNLDRRYEDETIVPDTEFPYRHAVGSMAHMSRTFRPDMAHAVSELSRHLGNAAPRHVKICKDAIAYLNNTARLGIVYHGNQSVLSANRLDTYSDADWAGDSQTRRSRSGHVVMLNGGAIEWFSKAQTIVTSSSCESETVAAVEALKTVLGLRILFMELKATQPGASTIKVDNMALALNSSSQAQSKRSKHFQLKTEFLRGYTRIGRVQLGKIHTSENLSDLMTKILSPQSYRKLRNMIMGITSTEARKLCGLE